MPLLPLVCFIDLVLSDIPDKSDSTKITNCVCLYFFFKGIFLTILLFVKTNPYSDKRFKDLTGENPSYNNC